MAQNYPKWPKNDARFYALFPQFFLTEKAVPQTFWLLECMLLRLLKNPCIGFSLSMEEHQNIWKLQELLLRDCVQGVRGDEGKHDGQQHHLPQQVPRSKQYWDEHHCLWSFLVLQKCFNITEWKFLNQNDHQDLYHRGEDAGSIQERFREVVRKHKKGNQHIFDIYSTYTAAL